MFDNPKYFKNEQARNYWLNSQSAYESSLKMAIDNIPDAFTESTNTTSASAPRKPIGIGENFVTAAKFKLDELYTGIAIEVQSIEDNNEKYLTFKAREKEIIEEFNSWKGEYFNQPSVAKEQEALTSQQTMLDEASLYDAEAAERNKDSKKALEAIIADGKDSNKKETINSDKDVRGFFFGTRFDNFVKASNTQLIAGDDLKRNFNDIHEDFEDKELRLGFGLSMARISGLERVNRAEELASHYQVAGISSDNLLSGTVPNKKQVYADNEIYSDLFQSMSYTDLFDKSGMTFADFPIVPSGDIQKTINAVEGYFAPRGQAQLDSIYDGPFKAIADKYGIPLDQLMKMQRSYLQEHNYIESK
jgi:hypothetical protein